METYKDGNILNQDTVTGFDNFLTVVSADILTWDLGKMELLLETLGYILDH